MSADLGVIKGVIELQDEFTSELGLAEAALHNFTKENQESLKAVAGAAGLVAAAFTAAAVAVYELGQRGTNINDVAETLNHFSGSAQAAEDNLSALRAGVKGTVDDFTLMKDASHLLSANVQLSAKDFGVLGEATLALQRRGLHGTVEMMDLVSDALINGKTKGLEAELGILNLDVAEQKYAKSLGITAAELSKAGVVEAHRIAIMERMREVIASSTNAGLNFSEQIEKGKAQLENWNNDLARAVASSPALAAGMNAISDAFSATFGANHQESIKTTMEYIKSGALLTVDFGLAAVEMARVVNVAWSAVKAIILGTEAVLVGIGAALSDVNALINAGIAALPGATESMKATAKASEEISERLHAMTASLAAEANEAQKGVTGNSAFDKTLDSLGGTLFTVRDAIDGAKASQEKHNEVVDIAAKNAATMAKLQAEWTAKMIDHQKIEDAAWKIEEKSLQETTALWIEYFNAQEHNTGTTQDARRADIEKTFELEAAKLDASDKNYEAHYAALRATADQALNAVGVDWDSVKDKSIRGLQQTLDTAIATYDAMASSSLGFTRGAMEEQRAKIDEARDALQGMGAAAVMAHNAATDAAKKHTAELQAQADKLKELQRINREMGGSRTYDLSTDAGMSEFMRLNPMAGFSGAATDKKYFKDHTIEDAIKAGFLNLYAGWKGPRLAEGGTVMVGENGPEIVRLPHGSTVYPNGTMPGGSGGHITNNFYVNGTAADVARKVSDHIMRTLKSQHQFGAA